MPGASVQSRSASARRPRLRSPSSWQQAAGRRLPARADLLGGIAAAVGSLVAATFALQLWRARLHVPLTYGGDGLLVETLIKGVISGGWISTNHSLGAPFGQQLYDFPLYGDNLNWLAIKLLGVGTGDPAKVQNAFFLLTFPTVSVAAYAVLRWMRISIAVAVVGAVLFAVAPYHLFRGEAHLLLSSYASVPIVSYLVLSILDRQSLFRPRAGPAVRRGTRWLSRRTGWTVLLCVLVGSLGIYYAIFGVLLIATAGLAIGVGGRSWRSLAQAGVLSAAIAATLMINYVPTIVYRAEHGPNKVAGLRTPEESETYGLNLAQMVLPVPGDRIAPLRDLRQTYDSKTKLDTPESPPEALGIVAVAGLLWLLAAGFAAMAGVGGDGPWLRRQRHLAFAALATFLIGTIGGFSALFAYLISPQLRGWGRISIFISFFAIAAVALGLDALRPRLSRRHRAWPIVVLGVVLVVGVYDQSSKDVVPDYSRGIAANDSDARFVGRIEHLVPNRAAIFQLPYLAFPESGGLLNMADYDPGRGYVHSSELRWSYGAMKGRPQDWAGQDASLPLPTLIDGVVAAGFSGVWIDRFAYRHSDDVALERALRLLIVVPAPIESRDRRFAFFSLTHLAGVLKAHVPADELASLRRAILYPSEVNWDGHGFYGNENGSRWAKPFAAAKVTNAWGVPRRMVFYSLVQTAARGRWQLTVTAPDGSRTSFAIGPKPRLVSLLFNEPPGTHRITFSSTAPRVRVPTDTRVLAVRYNEIALGGAGLTPFLPGLSH